MTCLKAAQLVSSTQSPISSHCLSMPQAGDRGAGRARAQTHSLPRAEPSTGRICGKPGLGAEKESIYSGENIFVLRVKGSHFQQFHALFAGPVLGLLREACPSRQSST